MPPIVPHFNDNLKWLQSFVPKSLDPKKITEISKFDGGIGVEWIKSGAPGTIVDDTTLYQTTSQTIKMTSTNGALCQMYKVVAMDFSTPTHINYSLYVDNAANLSSVNITVTSDTAFTKGYYFTTTTPLINGWNPISIARNLFTSFGSGPSWSTIVRVIVKVTSLAGVTVNANADDLYAYNGARPVRGAVVLTFDDQYISQFTAARPYLDKYHYPAVAAVRIDTVGTTAEFMSWSQLLDLQNNHSWDLISHSFSHPHLPTLSVAQVRSELVKSLTTMRQHGARPVPVFVYPFGETDNAVIDVVKEYFSYARSTDSICRQLPYPMVPSYRMPVTYASNVTTAASLKAQADLVAANKTVMIYAMHKVSSDAGDPLACQTAVFQGFIDYLPTIDVDVLTFSQLFA